MSASARTGFIALATFLIFCSQAEGKPPSAGQGGVNCPGGTIQKALDQAQVGDVINVTGTCVENIVITVDQVILNGGGTAVILSARPDETAVKVRATNVRIIGFTITAGSDGNGIHVMNGGSAIIRKNIISPPTNGAGRNGILVSRSSYAFIGTGIFPEEGNTIETFLKAGIVVRGSSNADIFDNTIRNNGMGIRVDNGGSADISGNTIKDNKGDTGEGILVRANAAIALSSDRNNIDPNVIEGNEVGIRCELGGALSGYPQNFKGDTTQNKTVISDDCHIDSALRF